MKIVGIRVSDGQPNNWQESVEDIMGGFERMEMEGNSINQELDSVKAIIEQIERSLQDVEEYTEKITNKGGLSPDAGLIETRKFDFYSIAIAIGGSILAEWASFLGNMPSEADSTFKTLLEYNKKNVNSLNQFLIYLINDDIFSAEFYVKVELKSYFDRLKKEGSVWSLTQEVTLITNKEDNAVFSLDEYSSHIEGSNDIEENSNTEDTSISIDDLVLNNIIDNPLSDTDSKYILNLTITIEGETNNEAINATIMNKRKQPEAAKVGYFLYSFASIISNIDGVKLYISSVKNGSVVINLAVEFENKQSVRELIDVLRLIINNLSKDTINLNATSETIIKQIHNRSIIAESLENVVDQLNLVANEKFDSFTADAKELILKKLNAELKNMELQNQKLQAEKEAIQAQKEVFQTEKAKNIIDILKPSIEAQSKITMTIGDTEILLHSKEDIKSDPKALLKGM